MTADEVWMFAIGFVVGWVIGTLVLMMLASLWAARRYDDTEVHDDR